MLKKATATASALISCPLLSSPLYQQRNGFFNTLARCDGVSLVPIAGRYRFATLLVLVARP